MTQEQSAQLTARRRYFTIAGTRLAGAMVIVLAIMTLQDVSGWSDIFGYLLLAAGLAAMLVIPHFMVRKWRSPPE